MKEMLKNKKMLIVFAAIFVVAVAGSIFNFIRINKNLVIEDKIIINYVDSDGIVFSDVVKTMTENNQLKYVFNLKNNSDGNIRYKLNFDVKEDSKIKMKHIDMVLKRDGIVEYNDSLKRVLENNVFDIGIIGAGEQYNYEVTFDMNFNLAAINNSFLSDVKIEPTRVNDIPTKVTMVMARNAKNEKIFNWYTTTQSNSDIQIVKKENNNKSITSFEGNKVLEFTGKINDGYFGEFAHSVKAISLDAGKEYYYRVGDKKTGVWSNVGEFVMDDGDDSFSFIYLTDLQTNGITSSNPSNYAMIKSLQTLSNAEFLVNAGDNVDRPNSLSDWNNVLKFNAFGNITSVNAAGNHDFEYGTLRAPFAFLGYFNHEINDYVNQETGTYYSFDYGNTHFTVLNTNDEGYWGISDEQITWLNKDLQNAQNADFRIVVMHRGAYTASQHYYDYRDTDGIAIELTSILDQYNVDLVLQGHDHSYSLSYPISGDGKAEEVSIKKIGNVDTMIKPTSPVYLLGGSAGGKFNQVLTLNNNVYSAEGAFVNRTQEEIKEHYSKFQKIDTPKDSNGNSLALFTEIKIDGKNMTVNTYSVDNINYGQAKLYNSFGISK